LPPLKSPQENDDDNGKYGKEEERMKRRRG
jgi:hypothetical protein